MICRPVTEYFSICFSATARLSMSSTGVKPGGRPRSTITIWAEPPRLLVTVAVTPTTSSASRLVRSYSTWMPSGSASGAAAAPRG